MRDQEMDWASALDGRGDALVTLRRDFHRHPELGGQEHRTASIIAERLHGAKLEVRTAVGGTGVVGILHGERPGPTIAWRADIDALPLTEAAGLPFASTTPGVMHACGHDGHAAIGITLAETLGAHRDAVTGTIVFVFQPAEETMAGASLMIRDGVLDDPPIEQVHGLHLSTHFPVGRVAVRPGSSMSSVDLLTIEVVGAGGHGAVPYLAVDPITTAANIVLGLRHLMSMEVPAQEVAVLTLGQFQAGTAPNIIPDRAVLRGSLRAFERGVRDRIVERLGPFVGRLAEAYRAEAWVRLEGEGCPVLSNDAGAAALVQRSVVDELGAGALDGGRLIMASDDMSRFLEARPGCYFHVGIGNHGEPPSWHHAPES